MPEDSSSSATQRRNRASAPHFTLRDVVEDDEREAIVARHAIETVKLIVMGARGLNSVGRSVVSALAVVRDASCPVPVRKGRRARCPEPNGLAAGGR